MPRRKNAAAEAEADPEMKLFGRKIPLRDDNKNQVHHVDDRQDVHRSQAEEEDTPTSVLDDLGSSSAGSCEEDKPEEQSKKCSAATNPGNSSPNAADSDPLHQQQQAAVANIAVQEDHQQQQQQQDKAAVTATTPKRPDKPVPCPRCNSMETKFCYFNNYNVNQPRHFCKNCQRYWTAGGTLRNVPVGAGRRKSKHSSSGATSSSHSWHHHHHHRHQEQINVVKAQQQQEQQQSTKVAASQLSQSCTRMRLAPPPALPPELCHFSTPDTSPSNSSMITSLNSSPVSMASNMFSMQMAKAAAAAAAAAAAVAPAGETSGSPVGKSSSVSSGKNWNNKASSNSNKSNSVVVLEEEKNQDCQRCSKPPAAAAAAAATEKSNADCNGCAAAAAGLSNLFNAGPTFWPYNFASWCGPGAAAASTPESQQQMQADMAAWLNSIWASGVPAWAPLAWNMPWAFAAAFAAAASNGSTFVPPPPPPPPPPQLYPKTLGKHAREGGRVEGCLWAPKTLRIEDPGEVAKSSFWTTLGLDKASFKGTAAATTSTQVVAADDKSQVHAAAELSVQENK